MGRTVEQIKREIRVCQLVLQDERVPRSAKWLLGLAIGYALSPIDLIPDFIPVLGYLDDVIIVPALLAIAFKLVPPEVIVECRNRIDMEPNQVR